MSELEIKLLLIASVQNILFLFLHSKLSRIEDKLDEMNKESK